MAGLWGVGKGGVWHGGLRAVSEGRAKRKANENRIPLACCTGRRAFVRIAFAEECA
jgi:hypothetical protein